MININNNENREDYAMKNIIPKTVSGESSSPLTRINLALALARILAIVTALSMLVCLPLPVLAEEPDNGGYEDNYYDIPGPDVSTISLSAASDTDLFTAGRWSGDLLLKIRINSPGYTFNNDDYIDNVESSNSKMGVWIDSVQDNLLVLNLTMNGGTDISSGISVTINGKTFPAIKVRVRLVSMDKSSVLLAKGKTAKLKVKCGKSTISRNVVWKSDKPGVAAVDKAGKVKAKKPGNAIISATIQGEKLGCLVSVSTKKKISAVKIATRIVKTGKYNQAKRMRNGYYDCSSLMWKAYHKNGCNFGSRYYAPTAADQAKYMARRHKMLGKCTAKKINSLYYQVGDISYHSGPSNGRYKNIYHTELFTGYSFYGFDSAGKPVVGMNSLRSYIGVGDLMARP